jgi:CRP-like cAMP-binding protein
LSGSKESLLPQNNRLLSALPKQDYERLRPSLEPVHLSRGEILYHAGEAIKHAYFLTSGMISLIAVSENGSSVAVAMTGNEGMAGIPTILSIDTAPYQLTVQIQGDALKIRGAKLKEEFGRSIELQRLLLRYMHWLLVQITQVALCNRFHSVEKRLCCWLLLSRDRAGSDMLHLTQEFLSQTLGTPRTNVTMVAGSIQRMGLISYSRGKIRILDARAIEAAACECYRVFNREIARLMTT